MNEAIAAPLSVEVRNDKAVQSFRELRKEAAETFASFDRLGAANDNLGSRFRRASEDGRGTASAFSGISREGKLLDGVLGGVNNTLGKIGFAGATAGAVGLAGGFVAVTKAATGYLDVMAKIRTNVDETEFDMGRLSEGILRQSAQFGAMPTKTAEAAYDIISAGAEDAGKALDILTASNKLAVGGIADVGVAADGLTSIVNSYAAQNLKAADASDAMFISARDGKVSIAQLSSELGKVTPLASAVGIKFDEIAGSVAVLTKGGIGPSESVTGVRAIISSIIKPSDEAAKMAKKLGIEFNSAALQSKGLRGVLQDVAERTNYNSDTMAKLYGGVEALVPALALTAKGGEDFAQTMDNMAHKAGSTDAAVRKMMEGSPTTQLNRLLASANVEMVKLGTTAAQVSGPALGLLADNMGTIVTIGTVALLPVATRIALMWGTTMVSSLATLATAGAGRFAALAASQGILAASTATLSTGMSGLLGLFGGPLAIGLAAAGAGIYTLASNSSAARATVDELAASAASTAKQASNTNTQSLMAARGVSVFGGQAGAAAQQLWTMASAARAAAIETAKLNFVKAKATFDTAYGQTRGGISRRAGAAMDELNDPNQTLGDAARSFGRLTQAGWDYMWRPSDKKAEAATREAFRRANAAGQAYRQVLGTKEEAYIPKAMPIAPGAPAGDPSGKGRTGGRSDAEKAADKLADFWKKVDGDKADAQATLDVMTRAAAEGRNLSIASADTAKQLELQRITGRDITEKEKERIALAQSIERSSKFFTDALVSSQSRVLDFEIERDLLAKRRAGMDEGQLEIERNVLKFRQDALKANVNLEDAAYVAAEKKLRAELGSADAIKQQNKQLEQYNALVAAGKGIAEKYSPAAASMKQASDSRTERQQLDAWYLENKNIGGPDVEKIYRDSVKGIERAELERINNVQTRWMYSIDQIASNFTGKVGNVMNLLAQGLSALRGQGTSNDRSLFGGIADMIGGKVADGYKEQGLKSAGLLSKAISNPLGSLKDGFTDFKSMFKNPGEGGFASVLGKGLAKAGMGAEMGGMADSLMKSIGLKSSKLGAQIGGGLGSVVGGPIGGAIGSVAGGLIGGLFKKTKYGTAVLTGAGDASVSGRGSAQKAAATGLAGNVQQGLLDLAAQLGGSVGAYNVSIGMYKDKYRVSTTGYGGRLGNQGSKTSALGIVDFGKDGEAAAIAYATQDAVKDGAITGLAPIIQKALSSLGTDSAIQFAKDWNSAMSDYKSLIDPIGAIIDNTRKPLEALSKTMVAMGASAEDMAQFQDYSIKKMAAARKEAVSGFQSLLDDLNGSGGGVSDYKQLNNKLAQFATYRADIAARKQVDQNAYTQLGSDIIGLAGNVYGTNTTNFQNIIGTVRDSTTAALGLANKAFDNADVLKATLAQTEAYTAQAAQTNALLAANNAQLIALNATMASVAQELRNENSYIPVYDASFRPAF